MLIVDIHGDIFKTFFGESSGVGGKPHVVAEPIGRLWV